MTPEQRQRVRDLFEAAVDLDPGEAARWVERAAPDDAVVRAELESLWSHHLRAGDFLARPIAEAVPELLIEDEELSPGTIVGPYRIVAEIGRGGMGRVYRATDTRLGRDVALKALAPALTGDARHRQRLEREARAAATLTHPGICTVYALEELDGAVYIAAEYVDGHTLREEMARQPRPPAESVTAMARELADALAAAHARGIVHRDLKPENVMRARDGRLKILDFGLARVVSKGAEEQPPGPTVAGALVGTLGYMAPEQMNGQPVDARADVFALGVLVYEYAAGVHPFEAPTPLATAARVLESRPEPLSDRRPDLPDVVAGVTTRCLAKSPSERFATAAEVVTALGRPAAKPQRRSTASWQVHQFVVIGLLFVASVLAWEAKELVRSVVPLSVFLAVGCAATVGSIFRGHLAYTATVHPHRLDAERRRTGRLTTMVDLAVAIALFVDGLLLVAADFVLYGLLTIALGLGIGLAAVWLEPATAAAVFETET